MYSSIRSVEGLFAIKKQECIPVGCVPSAAVAVSWEMSAQGRVSAGEGYLPRRVPARGVVCGVCLPRGV